MHVALLNQAFAATPLDPGDWMVCTLASAVLWADEAKKLMGRKGTKARRSGTFGP